MDMLRCLKKPSPFFQQFITDYFETREQLVCAFVLIDIRHEAQAIDLEFMSYMGERKFLLHHFTKADKISRVKIDSILRLIKEYVGK
jgi:GTP-binding protein